MTAQSNEDIPKAVRWLALGAVVGPVLFDFAWIIIGSLRPGYSFVSRPVSALAIGTNGDFMRLAFLLYGLLVTSGVIAGFKRIICEMGIMARLASAVLLSISPLGVLWDGIFTMEAPEMHTLGAVVAFSTPIIAFPIVGILLRRVPGWRRFGVWMLLGCPLTLALLIGFMQSVPPSEMASGGGNLGLWQRALLLEVQAWYMAYGWLAFRALKKMDSAY